MGEKNCRVTWLNLCARRHICLGWPSSCCELSNVYFTSNSGTDPWQPNYHIVFNQDVNGIAFRCWNVQFGLEIELIAAVCCCVLVCFYFDSCQIIPSSCTCCLCIGVYMLIWWRNHTLHPSDTCMFSCLPTGVVMCNCQILWCARSVSNLQIHTTCACGYFMSDMV